VVATGDDVHARLEDFRRCHRRDAIPPAEFSPLAMTTSSALGVRVEREPVPHRPPARFATMSPMKRIFTAAKP